MKPTDTLLHKYLLNPDPKSSKIFRYNEVMITLMSLLAEVPAEVIRNTRIYSRSPIRYIPFYSAHKGGGAITLGNNNWQSITYTENFFSADTDVFGKKAYANKINTWLRLSAHEVGHLNHATRFGSLIIYLIVFAYQYLKHGHDGAPLEHEANLGSDNLSKFKIFLWNQADNFDLAAFISSDLPESEKILQIKYWWSEYLSNKSNA